MPDGGLRPTSALHGAVVPGRHGAQDGPPGLVLRECDGLQVVSVASRRGQDGAVAAAVRNGWGVELPTAPRAVEVGGVAFLWSGVGQWLAVAAADAPALEPALRAACGPAASLTAQGDGRAVLRIAGPAARDVLATLVAIDLHPRAFRAGHVALTLANHVGVQLRQLDEAPTYELMAARGYGASVFEAVLEAGMRYGVEVLPS